MKDVINIVPKDWKEKELVRHKLSIGEYSKLNYSLKIVFLVFLFAVLFLSCLIFFKPNKKINSEDTGINTFLFYTPKL